MSLHTWSRVNQHISHKSSGPFQRYKHNITFLTAEVLHKFLFCTRKRQHFLPRQVPNSYTGKKSLQVMANRLTSHLNVFLFFSFCFFVNTVPWRQQWSNNAFVVVYPIYFSSLMKHKTENTHKTHYKAAVRLQWRDSMAQHGRLVISCTGTLRLYVTYARNRVSSLRREPGGGRCANVVTANVRTGLTITVGLQCIGYSRSDLSDKLHVNLHMHLAQG